MVVICGSGCVCFSAWFLDSARLCSRQRVTQSLRAYGREDVHDAFRRGRSDRPGVQQSADGKVKVESDAAAFSTR